MSDKSKIENEVAELKNLLSDAEERLRQLESDQAELKADRGTAGILKYVKKALIAVAVLFVVIKGGKIISRRCGKKAVLSPELNEELGLLLEEGKKKLGKKFK